MFSLRRFYLLLAAGISISIQACSGGGGGGITCRIGSGAAVTVSGVMTYDRVHHNASGGLDYNNVTQEPIRGAVVEAVCGGVIDSTVTDASGNYSVSIPGGTGDTYVRVKAQMLRTGTPSWNYSVVDNSSGQAVYVMGSSLFDTTDQNQTRNLRAVSGWTGRSYTQTRVAAPFAILDSVYAAHQLVLAEEPNAAFPALKINWNSNNTVGTYYDGSEIFVLGRANNDTDEYDYHVIIHEWGHYFQDKFSRDDSIGGDHAGGDVLDMRVAFSEGFGNAFSAIVSGDPDYADSMGLAQDGPSSFTFNLENNGCSNSGWFSECSIQSILYDLYDSVDDGSDGLTLGFAPLYNVLHNNMPSQYALTSIFSFISPLKSNVPSSAGAIDTLVGAQNIDSVADQYGTGETNYLAGTNSPLPIYSTSPGTLCSTVEHQGYNGLGVYRFIRVTGSGSSVTFNAARTSGVNPADPDLELFLRGQRVALAESTVSNNESLTATLSNGQVYVLQVYEYSYVDPNAPTSPTPTCFNMTGF